MRRATIVGWVGLTGIVALSLISLLAPRGDQTSTAATSSSTISTQPTSPTTAAPVIGQTFTVTVSGDVLIHERVADAARTSSGWDFAQLFEPVAPIITSADLAICHLEVPISSTNDDLAFGAQGVFRAPKELAAGLKAAGFDSCSVASNHAYDSGEASLASTTRELNAVGVPHVGVSAPDDEADDLWQFDIEGITVGHLAYTYGLNGRAPGEVPQNLVAQIDEDQILADAQRHRAHGSEFVIVSLHWGDEFSSELTEQQQTLGPRLLASENIDLIVGHHTHLPQAVTKIGDEYIAYGLGNFLSNQSAVAPECSSCPVASQDGVLLSFDIRRETDSSLRVVNVEATPTWVDVGGTWKVVSTEGPPAGLSIDTATLAASTERTMVALGVEPS